MASFELEELPSPSTFSRAPLDSPTKKIGIIPDPSIETSLPPPASDNSSRHEGETSTESGLEGEGQASSVVDRIERRRSSRGRRERARDNITVLGLKSIGGSRENASGGGYSRVVSDESDFYTPTTLDSLDLDTVSSSDEHDHRHPPTLHQKSVSRFRLRLLYTLISVVGIVMLALYTVIIIEHTQRKMMRKIQYYPGLGSQAQAQVAPQQGLLDTTATTGSTTGNADGVGTGSQESGLGPLKTGSDGADLSIADGSDFGIEGERPQGWKGVDVPASDRKNGPTILVPTGVSITITNETPAPQPIPPPPPKYVPPPKQQQQPSPPLASSPETNPSSIPASSVTIPGYPYPLSCGPTPATARAQNCVFDIMSYAWLPRPCYDHNLTTSFITMKSRSITLSSPSRDSKSSEPLARKTKEKTVAPGQTLSTGWRYYSSYNSKTPLDSSVVESGEIESVYVTWEWHREHCLFMWRKMHRSLLIYGGGGDILGSGDMPEGEGMGVERGKEMMIDGYVGDYGHTLKCGESLRWGEGIDGDEVNTLIRMKFPTCGVWAGGK